MANAFVWYDVMTTDVDAAEKFYSAVMGWTTADSGMPGAVYKLVSNGGIQVGGIMPIPEDAKAMGAKPAWMGYIGVADVDEYAKKVKAAGGMIHREPTDIPGVGRFAVAADPHGAGFILFQGSTSAAPAPVPFMAKGHIGWHELHAGNREEAFDFYAGLFGWTKDSAENMGGGEAAGGFIYQTFKTGGEMAAGGMMNKNSNMPRPNWVYYLSVGDIDAGAKRVKDNGGQVFMDVMQVPGGAWIAPCMDPQGAMFSLIGMRAN
jgi:uncharacterized protein